MALGYRCFSNQRNSFKKYCLFFKTLQHLKLFPHDCYACGFCLISQKWVFAFTLSQPSGKVTWQSATAVPSRSPLLWLAVCVPCPASLASTESHISRSAVQHQDSKSKLLEGIYFKKLSQSTWTGIGVVKLCVRIFIQRINFHLLTLLPFNIASKIIKL